MDTRVAGYFTEGYYNVQKNGIKRRPKRKRNKRILFFQSCSVETRHERAKPWATMFV